MKPNKTVKNRIILTLIFFPLILISAGIIIYSVSVNGVSNVNYRFAFRFRNLFAIVGTALIGISFVLFCLRLFLKYSNPKRSGSHISSSESLIQFRKFVGFITKIVQKVHIPAAILGFCVIMYHVYLAFEIGWVWKAYYVIGVIAATNLLLLIIVGIIRIWNKGIKVHKYLSFSLVFFVLLHLITMKI